MDVGTEIRRAREAKGWSQAKLAAGADMGVSGISQIETGARNPSVTTLSKIAEALGVGVADLFPKGQAPLPDFEDERRSPEVFEPRLAYVLEPVRADALREQRAADRVHASGGIPQSYIADIPEAEAARRFVGEFSPEEQRIAFGEVALGYARLERELAQVRELLRERDRKLAQLEENTRLSKEHEQIEAETA